MSSVIVLVIVLILSLSLSITTLTNKIFSETKASSNALLNRVSKSISTMETQVKFVTSLISENARLKQLNETLSQESVSLKCHVESIHNNEKYMEEKLRNVQVENTHLIKKITVLEWR